MDNISAILVDPRGRFPSRKRNLMLHEQPLSPKPSSLIKRHRRSRDVIALASLRR